MPKGKTPGKGAPREAREFDKTYLDVEGADMVHRDYLAHAFRWGFAHRFCKGRSVLDVGCGPGWPLGRVLQCHGNMGIRASSYLGVDLSPIKGGDRRCKTYEVVGEFDFLARAEALGLYDVVCSFEMLEHVAPERQAEAVRKMADRLAPGGRLLLSTPRNEGRRQARNHLRELSSGELAGMVEGAGLRVARRYGTFGDVGAIRRALGDAERAVWDELAEYYSDDVMACFMAPVCPDSCKNNLWVCERA